MSMLHFWGAAETVTGSKYLIEHAGKRLLVDCGLFQGLKKLRLRNWEGLPEPASSIDAVVLTHAHIDHSGFLPALVRDGFTGPIYCTRATKELCGILLPDAGHLQEEEAKFANKHGFSRHRPAKPLFTREDAERCLSSFEAVDFGEPIAPIPDVVVRFRPAGHILGAAWLSMEVGPTRIVFSGDIGRPDDPIMRPPAPVERADVLVLESTYGNRRHMAVDPKVQLAKVIRRTVERDGVVVIPSFAVGRAQALTHLVATLREAGEIPDVPVYLNSPMAISATELFMRHAELHRLDQAQCAKMAEHVEYVHSAQESQRLNGLTSPAIIISASGMASGGRVLHHIKAYGPDIRNTILFAGFQAAGTRGEAMVRGARQVKIHGEYVPIYAEVVNLEGLSAHADYVELGDWVETLGHAPRRVFLTHGEPAAADAMRVYLGKRFGWACEIPEMDQVVEL